MVAEIATEVEEAAETRTDIPIVEDAEMAMAMAKAGTMTEAVMAEAHQQALQAGEERYDEVMEDYVGHAARFSFSLCIAC